VGAEAVRRPADAAKEKKGGKSNPRGLKKTLELMLLCRNLNDRLKFWKKIWKGKKLKAVINRVARWFVFKPKIPIWVNF
jgi:hypothetical protein